MPDKDLYFIDVIEHFKSFFSVQISTDEFQIFVSDFQNHVKQIIFQKEDKKVNWIIKSYQKDMDSFVKRVDNEEYIFERNKYFSIALDAKKRYEKAHKGQILSFKYDSFINSLELLKTLLKKDEINKIKDFLIDENIRDFFAEFLLMFVTYEVKEYDNSLGYNIENTKTEQLLFQLTITEPQQPETSKLDEVKKEPKKLAEKWFALLYWIELNANGEQPPKNSEGAFIKSEIEAIRNKTTGKSGQSFYRAFIGIDLNNEKSIKTSFGKEWKKQIVELSENNPKIINYIQSKYTS